MGSGYLGVCFGGLLAGRKFGERKSDTVEEKVHFSRIRQEKTNSAFFISFPAAK